MNATNQPRTTLPILILALAASAGPASAASLAASWAFCDQPVRVHQVVVPGGDYGVTFFTTERVEAHTGFRVDVFVTAAGGGTLPDAWRFDAAGCQAESGSGVVFSGAGLFRCGDFAPATGSIVGSSYKLVSPSSARLRFTVTYAEPETSLAGLRSILAIARLPQFHGVYGAAASPPECGGLDTPVCLRIEHAEWQNEAGVWIPWDLAVPVLTAGPGGAPACEDEVESLPATWGHLKHRYR